MQVKPTKLTGWTFKGGWALAFLLTVAVLTAQPTTIVISEINDEDQVELTNTGDVTLSIGSYWLCNFPAYIQVNNLTVVCGSLSLAPGEVVVVSGWNVDPADGELGLYVTSVFGNPNAIIDYVEWGSGNHARSGVADEAGIWTQGTFVPAFAAGESLLYDGSGDAATAWAAGTPSLCTFNLSDFCPVEGGTLSGGPFEFCTGDGEADFIPMDAIALTGNMGSNSAWVITDEDGTILGLPPSFANVDFDSAGLGTCLVWHLSFEDDLTGAEVGMNANDLEGCFSLSNPIEVVRNQPMGGTITGGPFNFTVGDGQVDTIPMGATTLTDNQGETSQWVVTDDEGIILGLPATPSDVNFDGAGPGICLVWHLSYDGPISGMAPGLNANDLVGCFDLSNPIEINRVAEGDCQANGGDIFGGPFEFLVNDGQSDFIPADGIVLANTQGTSSRWVITDVNGTIMGLLASFTDVDFEGQGTGICLVWNMSFESGLMGAEVGMNVAGLEGCFDLSNSITVVRTEISGGTLEGGPFEFCVGDGEADFIPADAIMLTGDTGPNSAWVITDSQGNILELPASFADVNFDSAGPGTCVIWHLSFEDGLMGAEVGMNVNNLEGVFNLSNPIDVVRNQPMGGNITSGPYFVCAGDGLIDTIPEGVILLSGNSGTNATWVVTDEEGVILALPDNYTDVDFEDAPPGLCLIWHLSYEDGLVGLDVGANVDDIQGCFDFSNPHSVLRFTPQGGTLTGGPFEFCVGDDEADIIADDELELVDNEGSTVLWIITDGDGFILEVPDNISEVDFNEAPAGNCFIWRLSLYGANVIVLPGMSVDLIPGCVSLSNSIEVVRVAEGPLCVTSTEEINPANVRLELWPNPTDDLLRLRAQLPQRPDFVQIEIRNTLGQVVHHQILETDDRIDETLSIGDLPSGMYLLSIRTDTGLSTQQLMKQ